MKFGKRTALLSSMALQTGMFAWTAAAGSFHSLLAARCLQGFAAAAGEVCIGIFKSPILRIRLLANLG